MDDPFARIDPGLSGALIWLARAALVASALGALALGLMPDDVTQSLFPWDKAKHAFAFYVHTCIALVAFPRLPLWALIGGVFGYGVAIEALQALPGVARDASVMDLLANTVGIAMAAGPRIAYGLRAALAEKQGAALRRTRVLGYRRP